MPSEVAGDGPVTQPGHAVVRVDYYTDPLCCWSWALEPVWRQVRQRRGDALSVTVILGGMIGGWGTFRDPLNDVARPQQLAPLWHLAGRTAGVTVDPAIWHVDPPASSYPSCVAVKAAALQGAEAGERYLALAREAVMTRRLNVARREVLLQLAAELSVYLPRTFDLDRFAVDLDGEDACSAFRADLQRVRYLEIGRFPTIVAHGTAGSRIAVGYRPIEALEHLIHTVSPVAVVSGVVGPP